jgi:predicted anti-sigma-YlaC factor YlaD
VDCAEIRSGFVSGGIPEGPAVTAHVEHCPHCRELFEKGAALGRQLAQAVLPAPRPDDLLRAVEADLSREVGLRARLRAWPTRLRAAFLLGVAVALFLGSQLLLLPRDDFAELGMTFWIAGGFLVVWLLVGSLWLLHGATAPVATARLGSGLASVLLLVPACTALMAYETSSAWASPEICFGYGGVLVVPFVVAAWLVERRDRVPLPSLVVVGALAGVVANLLLHVHCPSAHLGHLLLGHASIGVAWALGLGLLLGKLQRRD